MSTSSDFLPATSILVLVPGLWRKRLPMCSFIVSPSLERPPKVEDGPTDTNGVPNETRIRIKARFMAKKKKKKGRIFILFTGRFCLWELRKKGRGTQEKRLRQNQNPGIEFTKFDLYKPLNRPWINWTLFHWKLESSKTRLKNWEIQFLKREICAI